MSENEGDLISRAAAIEYFENGEADVIEDYVEFAEFGFSIYRIKEGLNVLPAVDAQPVVHGRWVPASEFMPIFICSECAQRNLFKNGDNVFSNYCPNCGAKMDGGDTNA